MTQSSVWGPSGGPDGGCAGLGAASAAAVLLLSPAAAAALLLGSSTGLAAGVSPFAVDTPRGDCSDARMPSIIVPSSAALAASRYSGFMSENREVTPRRKGRRTYAAAAAVNLSPAC